MTPLDMTPGLAQNDSIDLRCADPILGSNAVARHLEPHVASTDLQDLLSSQFRSMVGFSEHPAGMASALDKHVLGIVMGRTEKQVIWSNACARIATVQDKQPVWNFAEVQHPREAMSADSVLVKMPMTVPVMSLGSVPQPTVTRFINPSPERFGNEGDRMILHRKASPFGVTAPVVHATRGHFMWILP